MNTSMPNIRLKYHHTALLVEKIKEAREHYQELFGSHNISPVYTVTSQKVRVCFVRNGKDSFIELVEPETDDSPVLNLLKKKFSYYHLGYKVKNIKNAVILLEKLNYKALEFYNSEAFEGKLCIFLYTPQGHLIELIEN